MPGVARQTLPADVAAYANSWEHLSDELRCLDLRLRQQVLKQPRSQTSDPLSPFKGLVITDAEIMELLAQAGERAGEPALQAEQQKVTMDLTELQAEIQERRPTSRKAGVYLSLPRLADLFGLTPLEEQCLLKEQNCAPRYERLGVVSKWGAEQVRKTF